jgi:ArsR family transcriptional regulator
MKPVDNAICKTFAIHEDAVNKVRASFPPENSLGRISELFKILGDKTKIKILLALRDSEMCVCDLSVAIELSQSAISHQLRILRQANIVKYRKEGKIVYYSLLDDHVLFLINTGLEHINE